MQIFIDSYSDSNFNATNVWFQEDLREKYSRYQSYGVILIYIFFFLKNSYNLKKKRRGEYFKKNNPRRKYHVPHYRKPSLLHIHFPRLANAISETERATVQKKSSFFFPPRRKETSPSPLSLSSEKKKREKSDSRTNSVTFDHKFLAIKYRQIQFL